MSKPTSSTTGIGAKVDDIVQKILSDAKNRCSASQKTVKTPKTDEPSSSSTSQAGPSTRHYLRRTVGAPRTRCSSRLAKKRALLEKTEPASSAKKSRPAAERIDEQPPIQVEERVQEEDRKPEIDPNKLMVQKLARNKVAAIRGPVGPAAMAPAPLAAGPMATAAPAQVAPTPVAPTPVAPSPVAPAPMAAAQLAPAQLAPAQLAPAQLAPAQLAPAQLAPAQLAPAQLAPAQLAPAQFALAPVTPAQVAPAPVTPAPMVPPLPWIQAPSLHMRFLQRQMMFPTMAPNPSVEYTLTGQEVVPIRHRGISAPWVFPRKLYPAYGSTMFRARGKSLDVRTWTETDVLIWSTNFLAAHDNFELHALLEEFKVDGTVLYKMVTGQRGNNMRMEPGKFDLLKSHAAAVMNGHTLGR